MSIVLDVLVLAIIGITAFIAAKKGFVATVIEFVGLLIAFYLAFSLSAAATNFTYDKFISPSIRETITESVTNTVTNTVDDVWDSLPGIVVSGANTLGIDKEDLSETIGQNSDSSVAEIAENVDNKIARPVITGFMQILIGFILFIILLFVVKILAKVLNKLFSFSILGKLNKVLGAVLGVFKGAVIAVAVVLLVSTITAVTKNGFLIFTNENIEGSTIFGFIASFNPFY